VLFKHQQTDFERYKDMSELGIFWEMGCVDSETEFFSQEGWKQIDLYTKGDLVLQWNPNLNSAELVMPMEYIRRKAGLMYNFKDQVLSKDHRVVNYIRHKDIYDPNVMTVQEMIDKNLTYISSTAFKGYKPAKTWKLNEWHTRLSIALQLRASTTDNVARIVLNADDTTSHKRLKLLLSKAKVKYEVKAVENVSPLELLAVEVHWLPLPFNSDWFSCPPEWFLDEIPRWELKYYTEQQARMEADHAHHRKEGYNEYKGKIYFNTPYSRLADIVQFMYASQNKWTRIKYDVKKGVYTVEVTDKPPYVTQSKKQVGVYHAEKIWRAFEYCFTVPSTYLILRRNGRIFITGNCGKSALVLRVAGHKFRTKQIDSLLVISPNDLHLQWAREQIPLWLDVPYNIQCLFGRGGQKKTYPFDNDPEFLQVVCVNIDTFSTPSKWKDITDWSNARRTFIILDEATTIKSVTAQRTQRILYAFNNVIRKRNTILQSTVRSVARAVLTGTPVTNGPMDLWAICEFIRPNFFGRNWYSFKNYYGMYTSMMVSDANGAREINVPLNEERWHGIKACLSYNEAAAVFGCSLDTFNTIHAQDSYQGPYKNLEELKELLKPIASFKLLRDCVDLPKEIRMTRDLSMTPEIKACYNSMVEEYIATYADHVTTALNKLAVLIRLQQISSGFICDKNISIAEDNSEDAFIHRMYELDIEPDEIQWIGKSNPKLDALYRDINEIAKPVIVITRFSAEAARIYEDLRKNLACCLITGWRRVGTIEEFKQGKYDVMVANSAVISRGFNLQNSHTMCFYSNTFSLELRLQAEGRINRVGQTESCSYIDYCYANTIDEKVIGALKLKRNLLDYIRNTNVREMVA
jgi:hypothetical protein